MEDGMRSGEGKKPRNLVRSADDQIRQSCDLTNAHLEKHTSSSESYYSVVFN